jgi:hypothetical protein
VSTTTFNYRVTIEGQDPFDVVADQRDIAAFELQPFGCPFYEVATRPFTFARFISFRSARRNGKYAGTWDEFGDQCVSVESLDEEGEAPEADPGSPAVSAGS